MSVEIDPTTNLAKLPPGYFFKIKRWHLSNSSYNVILRVRRKVGIFSIDIHVGAIAEYPKRSGHTDIEQASEYAAQELGIGHIKAPKEILGKYPPNKFERE